MSWDNPFRAFDDRTPLDELFSIGDTFAMTLKGRDKLGLTFGWTRPPGYQGNPVMVRVGEPGSGMHRRTHRVRDHEAGSHVADNVMVEITGIGDRSVFARVVDNLGCCFARYSDADGNFDQSYQHDLKGKPRLVSLNYYSPHDVRDAISQAGRSSRGGFMGVTVEVDKVKFLWVDRNKNYTVMFDKWYTMADGNYRIKAHPKDEADQRDVEKEVWVADFNPRNPVPDYSYKWIYEEYKGVPHGIENALLYNGTDQMFIIHSEGVKNISRRPMQKVVDDFSYRTAPDSFRMIIAPTNHVHKIEGAIRNSRYGLEVQRFPSVLIKSYNSKSVP